MFCRRVTLVSLLPPSEDEDAALFLPPITKRKTKFGRRRLFLVNRGQLLLIVLPEFFAVWNKPTVEVQSPAFVKCAERNSGVVLNDHAAVIEKEIANAAESFVVHEVRGSFDQTDARPAGRAPTQESTVAS